MEFDRQLGNIQNGLEEAHHTEELKTIARDWMRWMNTSSVQ